MTRSLQPSAGRGGLPRVELVAADGARAEVYLHGAHVTSWVPAGGAEQLFVSSRSEFREGAAIRGGVPVIFPQFGPGPLPKHGFARTTRWELADAEQRAAGAAVVQLRLRSSAATMALWPHPFAADLVVSVESRALRVSLALENVGAEPLRFTAALHSYLRVDDVAAVAVRGLCGTRYIDQAAGGREQVDSADPLRIDGEVDRVYVDPPRRLLVLGASAAGALAVEATGFPDAVIWNPGPDKARALTDLGDGEYRQLLCVEAAAAAQPVAVAPGARWEGAQQLTLGEHPADVR